jgi:hypothetical protein
MTNSLPGTHAPDKEALINDRDYADQIGRSTPAGLAQRAPPHLLSA